jgi:hypothetical protein
MLFTMREFNDVTAKELEKLEQAGKALEERLGAKIQVNIKIHGTMIGLLAVLRPQPVGLTHECLHHLFVRSIKSHRAVTINVLEGLEEDANNALRSMIDHAFTANYIASDVREGTENDLAVRYTEYSAIERWKSSQRLEEMRGIDPHPLSEELRRQIDKSQRAFVKKYLGGKATYKDARSWHSMGMKNLRAKSPENFKIFYMAYENMCMSSHPSWVTKRLSTDLQTADGLVDAFPRCHDDSILWMSGALVIVMAAEYCERDFSGDSNLRIILHAMFELLHSTQPELMAQIRATKSGYLGR